MSKNMFRILAIPAVVAAAMALGTIGAGAQGLDDEFADELRDVLTIARQGVDEASQSQDRIDATVDRIDALKFNYNRVLKQLEGLQVYNRRQERVIVDQNRDMANLQKSINDVTVIRRQITPLIERMLETLERFVELDIPFLLEERQESLVQLRDIMDQADVPESEKFRLVLEAYQREMEYGRTIRAYEDILPGREISVVFLQVGRVALVYQTVDGEESGFWNKATGQWEELGQGYASGIKEGIQIAQNQVAPNLIRLPVSAPEQAQ